jgi:hypothetical protein
MFEACARTAEQDWGPILDRSEDFAFTETAYYEKEMGPSLRRTFICHAPRLEDPAHLVERKYQAHGLENRFSTVQGRTVNLDPGYLNGHQVVIATFKDFAHRIPLGRGVFAHLEYLFRHGRPEPLPWTYPDFRREDHRRLFAAWRARFVAAEGEVSPAGGAGKIPPLRKVGK